METSKNNAGENKSAAGNNAQNPLGGFDLNGIMNDPKIMEVIKHLLSGGGAMAGSYFIWIKPLQDKIDALTNKVNEQSKVINEMQEELDSLSEEAEEKDQGNLNGSRSEYFHLRKGEAKKEGHCKYRV